MSRNLIEPKRDFIPDYHHSVLKLTTVISDVGIGELDCPKSP